ncbi:hypothetical protein C8F04DRAFT_1245376 [Mycena alexandri]|uniref:Uncharacterized protein n=1 Tax=Mycena alexandri TaxID=1745969 RepID=A0AAD6RWM4_9AGAR|nr:hypothetical protein C8F04DRAFT_1245376 [Mycena alexandri]
MSEKRHRSPQACVMSRRVAGTLPQKENGVRATFVTSSLRLILRKVGAIRIHRVTLLLSQFKVLKMPPRTKSSLGPQHGVGSAGGSPGTHDTRGAGDAASASGAKPTEKRKSPDLQEAGMRKRSRVRCAEKPPSASHSALPTLTITGGGAASPLSSTVRERGEAPWDVAMREREVVRAKREPEELRVKREPEELRVKRERGEAPWDVAMRDRAREVRVKREPEEMRVKRERGEAPWDVVMREPEVVSVKREPEVVMAKREPEEVQVKKEPVEMRAKREPEEMRVKRELMKRESKEVRFPNAASSVGVGAADKKEKMDTGEGSMSSLSSLSTSHGPLGSQSQQNGDGSREQGEGKGGTDASKLGADVEMPLAHSTSTPTPAPDTRAGGDVPMPPATLITNTNTLAAAAPPAAWARARV